MSITIHIHLLKHTYEHIIYIYIYIDEETHAEGIVLLLLLGVKDLKELDSSLFIMSIFSPRKFIFKRLAIYIGRHLKCNKYLLVGINLNHMSLFDKRL